MFNYSKQEIADKIKSLTYDEVKQLENGISLDAILIVQKLFPNDSFINWFVEMKRRSQ